jgi:hypothetical protein
MDTSEQTILDETPKREARRPRSIEEKPTNRRRDLLEAGESVARVARRRERLESRFLSTAAQQLRLTARLIPLWITIAFAPLRIRRRAS